MITLPFNATVATRQEIDNYIKQGILYEDESGIHISQKVKSLPTTNQNRDYK